MGYQRSVITRWSKGSKPRDATISKVAAYFDVSSELFAEEEKEMPITLLDDRQKKMIDLLNSLNEDHQKEALDFLMYLSSQEKSAADQQ